MSVRSSVLSMGLLTFPIAAFADHPLNEAESILAKLGATPSASLKVDPLARAAFGPADLVGNWRGVFVAGDFQETVEVTIGRDGDITFKSNEGTGKGTWKLNGDTLEIDNANGVSLKYKVKDGEIRGSGTSEGVSWTVTFKRK